MDLVVFLFIHTRKDMQDRGKICLWRASGWRCFYGRSFSHTDFIHVLCNFWIILHFFRVRKDDIKKDTLHFFNSRLDILYRFSYWFNHSEDILLNDGLIYFYYMGKMLSYMWGMNHFRWIGLYMSTIVNIVL